VLRSPDVTLDLAVEVGLTRIYLLLGAVAVSLVA
jgi:hypothetical protein